MTLFISCSHCVIYKAASHFLSAALHDAPRWVIRADVCETRGAELKPQVGVLCVCVCLSFFTWICAFIMGPSVFGNTTKIKSVSLSETVRIQTKK